MNNKQKVLLTGAFGNIGRFAMQTLLRAGHHVVALDKDSKFARSHAKTLTGNVSVVWGDITDEQCLIDALVGVDAVIHLAAIIPPLTEERPELTQAINLDATKTFIQLMEQSPTAKRLVFASSIAVFGKNQFRDRPLCADDQPCPDDHYGRSKADCEQAIQASNLDWTILRIAVCPPANAANLVTFIGNSVFEGHPDGRVEVLHPQDGGTAFANAVDCDESIHKILYLGGGEANRLNALQLTNLMLTTMGLSNVPRETMKITDNVEFYGDWVDTEESQRLLQFQQHGPEDNFIDLKLSLGVLRHGLILVKLFRPVIMWFLVRSSPYYKAQKATQKNI